jgi:hypothetical protein
MIFFRAQDPYDNMLLHVVPEYEVGENKEIKIKRKATKNLSSCKTYLIVQSAF